MSSYPALVKNNSQKAGCIRLSPASHCCHTRQVVWSRVAAAVWVRPADSRAARISAGDGLAGPERFGCAVMALPHGAGF